MTDGMPAEVDWRALRDRARHRRFRTGQFLFREGDPSDHVLALLEGRVKICLATPNGREVVLALKGPRELVGELGAIDGRPRSASAVALEPVEALVTARASFHAFLEEHPQASRHLLAAMSAHMRDAARRNAEQADGDVASRVRSRLAALTARMGEHAGPATVVPLPISQEELAGWVGASREAVNRALRDLRNAGVVRTGRGRIVVLDATALETLGP